MEKEKGTAEQDIEFFESLLKQYFVAEKEKDNKFKLSTPYGKVTSRNEIKWAYDEETLINSLKQLGLIDFIEVKESLNKKALKNIKKHNEFMITEDGKISTSDGEIIDGVTISNDLKTYVNAE